MNARTNILKKNFNPSLAIMVYDAGDNDYYLESHNIDENGQVLEGKPLLQETIQGVVNVLFEDYRSRTDITGIFPNNLLNFTLSRDGSYKMLWFNPATVRVIHYAPALKLPTEQVWVPATLYRVINKELYVYSFIGEERPTEATGIYKPPFHNISDDGRVCLGNAQVAKPKESTYANMMNYWEDLFWLSEFTHINGQNKTKSDMGELWKKMIASKTEMKFPDDELLPMISSRIIQKQLKDIL